MERTVKRNVEIQKGPLKETLIYHGKGSPLEELKQEALQSLSGANYLDDRIIDQYMLLIKKRNEADTSLPKVYMCTTYIYTKLVSHRLKNGMNNIHNWIKEDIRLRDLIFFPIHKDDHWSLIAVETSTKTVNDYDSIIG